MGLGMAYDEGLVERIRDALIGRPGVTEKKMFGGVCYLVDGKMFVGVLKDELMVRTGPDGQAAALARPHVRPMDFTGKPMKGYVYVAAPGLEDDAALRYWLTLAAGHAATLPASLPRAKKARGSCHAGGAAADPPAPEAAGGGKG